MSYNKNALNFADNLTRIMLAKKLEKIETFGLKKRSVDGFA